VRGLLAVEQHKPQLWRIRRSSQLSDVACQLNDDRRTRGAVIGAHESLGGGERVVMRRDHQRRPAPGDRPHDVAQAPLALHRLEATIWKHRPQPQREPAQLRRAGGPLAVAQLQLDRAPSGVSIEPVFEPHASGPVGTRAATRRGRDRPERRDRDHGGARSTPAAHVILHCVTSPSELGRAIGGDIGPDHATSGYVAWGLRLVAGVATPAGQDRVPSNGHEQRRPSRRILRARGRGRHVRGAHTAAPQVIPGRVLVVGNRDARKEPEAGASAHAPHAPAVDDHEEPVAQAE
jgi:hypothetical protein